MIGNGLVAVAATFIGIWMMNRYARRTMSMGGLCAVFYGAHGTVLLLFPAASPTKSLLALSCILLALLFIQMMVSPLYRLLMSELFPMRVRGALTGLSVAAQWMFNATTSFLFPIMLHAMGATTFFGFAAIYAWAPGCARISLLDAGRFDAFRQRPPEWRQRGVRPRPDRLA